MQRDGGPGGPGAGGNPTGGSFTGPAEALEIIGDHAYAYAALAGANAASITRLDFTSGNYYFVGRLTCNGSCDTAVGGVGNGNTTAFSLSFNGTEVVRMKTETEITGPEESTVYNDIIIPPYTEVKLTSISNSTRVDRKTSCLLTGRIYRG